MAKIYIAGAFARQDELLGVSKKLQSLGYEITARWLSQEDTKAIAACENDDQKEKLLRIYAYNDYYDVMACDILVRFSDAEAMQEKLSDSKLVSGARHFEHGVAWVLGKRVIVVGGKQNIFDRLDGTEHVEDVEELCQLLHGGK
jgi:hypothetical protein